jgi:hypothetical protein
VKGLEQAWHQKVYGLVTLSLSAVRKGFFYPSCAGKKAMKKHFLNLFVIMNVMIPAVVFVVGCDSGEKARDELTGNRAVKQYHQSTKNVEKIVDRQTEKHKSIPDDENQESK